jgi:quinol monooxygenase YgiN
MISIIFNLKTKTNKNLEFLQSMGSIITGIRNTNGCMNIDFQLDNKDKERFSLQLDWKDREQLIELFESEDYKFFEGALRILCEAPIIEVFNDHDTVTIDVAENKNKSIRNQIKTNLNTIL